MIGKVPSIEFPLELDCNTLEPCVILCPENQQLELSRQFVGDEAKSGIVLAEFRVFAHQTVPSVVQLQIDGCAGRAHGGRGPLLLLLQLLQQLHAQLQVMFQPVIVAKDFVGLLYFLKLLAGLAVFTWLDIRVKFLGQCPMGRLDDFWMGLRGKAKYGVVVLAWITLHFTQLTTALPFTRTDFVRLTERIDKEPSHIIGNFSYPPPIRTVKMNKLTRMRLCLFTAGNSFEIVQARQSESGEMTSTAALQGSLSGVARAMVTPDAIAPCVRSCSVKLPAA